MLFTQCKSPNPPSQVTTQLPLSLLPSRSRRQTHFHRPSLKHDCSSARFAQAVSLPPEPNSPSRRSLKTLELNPILISHIGLCRCDHRENGHPGADASHFRMWSTFGGRALTDAVSSALARSDSNSPHDSSKSVITDFLNTISMVGTRNRDNAAKGRRSWGFPSRQAVGPREIDRYFAATGNPLGIPPIAGFRLSALESVRMTA
jgi:hypothetical protein